MSLAGADWGVAKWLGRTAASAAFLCAGLLAPRNASAEGTEPSRKVAVGFTNLIARLDDDEIGIAKAQFRVHILEALREGGFNAVGAENLVFGKDESSRADLLLGGTVKQLECRHLYRQLRCRVAVEWQLLDRERDQVVYRVLTRYAGLDLPRDNDFSLGKQLILGALGSLMSRERFKQLANAPRAPVLPDDATHPAATFTRCDVGPRELPASFDAIAAATLIVKSGDGIGSGFVISPDGLIMTAAHVVLGGKVVVRGRDGATLPAEVVRISRKQDVALLALDPSVSTPACLALEPAQQTPGTDVYAIGAPGGEELGFSLSRGIVSGIRSIEAVELIQTDASISPGNSGGPLVNGQGRAVGVVSRKLAGQAMEGLGFAVPLQAGLTALSIQPGTSTTPGLRRAPAPIAARASTHEVNDKADEPVSLDPESDRQRAVAADYTRRVHERENATPGYVKPMRWVGFGLGIAGALGAFFTWQETKQGSLTRPEYESLRLKNDLSWVAVVLGSGSFTASYFLEPKLAPSKLGQAPRWSIAAAPGRISLSRSFQ